MGAHSTKPDSASYAFLMKAFRTARQRKKPGGMTWLWVLCCQFVIYGRVLLPGYLKHVLFRSGSWSKDQAWLCWTRHPVDSTYCGGHASRSGLWTVGVHLKVAFSDVRWT